MKKVLAWMGRHYILTAILACVLLYSIGTYEPPPDIAGLTCAEMQEKLAAQERETLAKQNEMNTIKSALVQEKHYQRIGVSGPRALIQIEELEEKQWTARSAWQASQRKFEALYKEVAEAECKADE